jgi:acetyltransferase-like isoleucine patch superfamily enzyme
VNSSATAPEFDAGPFTSVSGGASIGEDCRFGAHVTVEDGACLGDRVTVGSGTHVCENVCLGDDVTVGFNVSFAEPIPAVGVREPVPGNQTTVRDRAAIGAGAVLLAGVEIGLGAVVEPGSVVRRSVPRGGVVAGNPAQIVGYVNADSRSAMDPVLTAPGAVGPDVGVFRADVRGVELRRFSPVDDLRGSLFAVELERLAPFVVRRFFAVFDVPSAEVRGEHAHYRCHQFLICLQGSLHVIADDGSSRQEFVLTAMRTGLYLPPMTWGIQYRYSPGTILGVLASDPYDPTDYIRDYDEFIRAIEASTARSQTGLPSPERAVTTAPPQSGGAETSD